MIVACNGPFFCACSRTKNGVTEGCYNMTTPARDMYGDQSLYFALLYTFCNYTNPEFQPGGCLSYIVLPFSLQTPNNNAVLTNVTQIDGDMQTMYTWFGTTFADGAYDNYLSGQTISVSCGNCDPIKKAVCSGNPEPFVVPTTSGH